MVVLVSGDPLFYGLARYLCEKLGKDRFEVLPARQRMQLAFAGQGKLGRSVPDEPGQPAARTQVLEQIRIAEKVGLFTSEECPPSQWPRPARAGRSITSRVTFSRISGSPDERVTRAA